MKQRKMTKQNRIVERNQTELVAKMFLYTRHRENKDRKYNEKVTKQKHHHGGPDVLLVYADYLHCVNYSITVVTH